MSDSETPSGMRKALTVTPESWIRIKAGTLWAVGTFLVGCTITCTVYVVRMSDKTDRALEGIGEIDKKLEPMRRQIDILWDARRQKIAIAPMDAP